MALSALSLPAIAASAPAASSQTADFETLNADFAKWMAEAHVPGLVWGIVKDGKLVHAKAMGVQTVEDNVPVTPDTAFRIASMTKAFTGYSILKLRDEGKLRLDDPASKYVPEMKGWANGITVGDLLHHTAGFVTDDPWGDRQQPLPEAELTIDNVGRELVPQLDRTLETNAPIQIVYRDFLVSRAAIGPSFVIKGLQGKAVSVGTFRVTGRAGFFDLVNGRFPLNDYRVESHRGLEQ